MFTWPVRWLRNTFFRYCITGAIGFAVDMGVLLLALFIGFGPIAARMLSISFAITTTWLINRRFTFAQITPPSSKEWLRYALMNGAGFVINVAVYSLCVLSLDISPPWALSIASAIALGFNYLGNRWYVFSSSNSGRDALP